MNDTIDTYLIPDRRFSLCRYLADTVTAPSGPIPFGYRGASVSASVSAMADTRYQHICICRARCEQTAKLSIPPKSGNNKYQLSIERWFGIGQVTKVSGWTVLGRFYSHLAFCNYFWPLRYRVGIVGIRNLGYRRRDRELDTCPSRYHQKMLGIIPIRRYWYLGCDTESIPSRFLRNVRIVKKWAIPCYVIVKSGR